MVIDTRGDTITNRQPRKNIGAAQRAARTVNLATRRLHSLPDFVIIGAQRCGTSSLFRYLKDHPQLQLPRVKEIHFFDNNYQRGTNWYRAHFPSWLLIARSRAVGKPLQTGEASPYYLFHPLAPQRLHALMPSARLVVLLRNPIDRAYSHYHHETRLGYETLPFSEAIEREPERLAGEADRIVSDASYRSLAHQHHSYLARGIYVDQLKMWRRWFPEEQILVIQSESFYRNPAETLLTFESFNGLREWLPSKFEIVNEGKYEPMDPRIRTKLADYFRPHNQRLFEFLGREFDWET